MVLHEVRSWFRLGRGFTERFTNWFSQGLPYGFPHGLSKSGLVKRIILVPLRWFG